jgi:hypothetical protein
MDRPPGIWPGRKLQIILNDGGQTPGYETTSTPHLHDALNIVHYFLFITRRTINSIANKKGRADYKILKRIKCLRQGKVLQSSLIFAGNRFSANKKNHNCRNISLYRENFFYQKAQNGKFFPLKPDFNSSVIASE